MNNVYNTSVYKTHKTRDVDKKKNHLSGGYKKKERFLRNDNGTLITSSEEIVKRWGEYFCELLNCVKTSEFFSFKSPFCNNQECPRPTLEEIKMQIKLFKNYKSPSEDDIQLYKLNC